MKNPLLVLFLLLAWLPACGKPSQDKISNVQDPALINEPSSFYDQVQQSAYILIAEIQRVESWKGRKDWWIVTLKPEKIIKGDPPASFKILSTQLFPNQPMSLKEGERALLFLRPLPPFTAWQELISHSVQFDVLGGAKGIYKFSTDVSLYSDYAEQLLKIQALQDEAARKKVLQEFDAEILQKNPPGTLSASIVANDFQSTPVATMKPEDLQFWLERAKDPRFAEDAKLLIAAQLTSLNSEEINHILKQMFCLPPNGLCLKVAETLESRNIQLPLNVYSHEIETGNDELRVGLLTILARHQRKDAFKLFEKSLRREKDQMMAASLIQALSDFQSPQAEALVISYAKDPRYHVRAAVAASLGKLKSAKGIPLLESYLKTKDPSMVSAAAEALKQIGSPEALQTLGKYYQLGHHGTWEPAEPQHLNGPTGR